MTDVHYYICQKNDIRTNDKLIYTLLILLILVCATNCQIKERGTLNGDILQEALSDMLEEAGLSYLEDELEQSSVTYGKPQGTEIVQSIITDLEKIFRKRLELLDRIVDAANIDEAEASNYTDCCKLEDFDSQRARSLGGTIAKDMPCIFRSLYVPSYALYPNRRFFEVAVENLKQVVDKYRYQILGTEDGIFYVYPAPSLPASLCATYDNRFRPYYVGAVGDKRKSLVIAANTAVRQEQNRKSFLQIFSLILDRLLNGLTSKDDVAFVTHPFSPDNLCVSSELRPASQKFKHEISEEAQRMSLENTTSNYSAILDAALENLAKNSHIDKQPVLLFITSSFPDASDGPVQWKRVFANYFDNPRIRWINQPILLIYAVGRQSLYQSYIDSLSSLFPGPSNYILVPTAEALPVEVLTYYRHLPINLSGKYFLSDIVPDYSFTNAKFFLSKPIIKDEKLVAVACFEIDHKLIIDTIIGHVGYGSESYSFIFDNVDGLVIQHPLFPIQERLEQVHIKQLETSEELRRYIDLMQDGQFTNNTVYESDIIPDHTIVSSTASSYKDAFSVRKNVTLHFGFLRVEGREVIEWVVCYLQASDSSSVQLPPVSTEDLSNISFVYHRVDLDPASRNYDICTSTQSVTIKDKVSTFLNPIAFLDPAVIQFNPETFEGNVLLYKNIISGVTKNTIFNDNLLSELKIVSFLDDLWTVGPLSYDLYPYHLRRYATFQFGSTKIYPGPTGYAFFDFLATPEHQQTLADRGRIHLSTPYSDAFGSGIVISLSKTVSYSDTSEVFGVLAVDMSIMYFKHFLEAIFWRDCFNFLYYCFLIDKSGFVVFHESWFFEQQPNSSKVIGAHVIEQEPEVAIHLLEQEYMTKLSCLSNFEEKIEFYYNVQLDSVNHLAVAGARYKATAVQGTALFLFQRVKTEDNAGNVSCVCVSRAAYECTLEQDECECPCYTPLDRSSCSGIEEFQMENPCVTDIKAPYFRFDGWTFRPDVSDAGIASCNGRECRSANISNTCWRLAQCSWCQDPFAASIDLQSTCYQSETCPNGVLSGTLISLEENVKLLIAVTLSITFALVGAIGLIGCWCRRMGGARVVQNQCDAMSLKEDLTNAEKHKQIRRRIKSFIETEGDVDQFGESPSISGMSATSFLSIDSHSSSVGGGRKRVRRSSSRTSADKKYTVDTKMISMHGVVSQSSIAHSEADRISTLGEVQTFTLRDVFPEMAIAYENMDKYKREAQRPQRSGRYVTVEAAGKESRAELSAKPERTAKKERDGKVSKDIDQPSETITAIKEKLEKEEEKLKKLEKVFTLLTKKEETENLEEQMYTGEGTDVDCSDTRKEVVNEDKQKKYLEEKMAKERTIIKYLRKQINQEKPRSSKREKKKVELEDLDLPNNVE